ncbi:GntR family transcriptional regulator [Rhodoferax koreense]|uniref:GntR family transcriptional regulator n=1 Tax=Rhodoferax koreensis TaxID=1842727 RepID=A0A1P8JZ91_9BURK|nr:FCD domain-containing protein [Rhodoferax koreense]APW39068.1 GntR family transcriptional regulator [Rhodoferax koreense]
MKARSRAMRLATVDGQPPDDSHQDISLAEQARRSLRRDITLGLLQAGQTLRLEFLKERYGISFSPIREALTSLEGERLVVSTPSKGFRVAPLSEEEMWDAIETRILIDCEALRRSLKAGDDDWEVQLVSAFHALKLAAKAADQGGADPDAQEALELRHMEFHNSLVAACGSTWLRQLSGQLYAHTERYRRPNLRPRYGPLQSATAGERDVNKEHAQLLAAAVDRDVERACELVASHYRATGHMIVDALRRKSEQASQTEAGMEDT